MQQSVEELIARRERLLGVGTPLFYEQPIHLVRGDGAYVYDADGKRYVDMYNNVPCVGHANPHVVEAMRAQAATINVHSRYLHQGVLDYAERIVAKHHASLERVVFSCTGTEANEIAIGMARFATQGRGIICTDRAYHGNSELVNKLTWADCQSDPEIRWVHYPQTYRPIEDGLNEAELADRYLSEVEAAINSFAEQDIPLAGMLVCPLLANEGLPNIPKGYMAGAAKLVRNAGGLFIADEVQAGFCRSGQWWGYETSEVVPDIVSMGKPMGNGLPLSGVVARGDLVDTFRKRSGYFNTFAASPLQAAVGAAVLDVIEKEQLQQHVAELGDYLRDGIARVQCEAMGDIRGHGLFVGIDWVSNLEARTPDREGAVKMVNKLKEKGILTSNAGSEDNIIKLRPPLVFGRQHADLFLEAFEQTVRELY
ncbi:MAG: aspartate aminotransferase family protein [Halieaceae bacterium]|jgi:4-aminobutyrate aminotransferase-like enzyme|nr:aspartate aminotransferase family protein [Halieaceae bacterium]